MPAQPPDGTRCPQEPGRKTPGGRRPLPDAAAVRLYRVPDPAPPYDAEPFAGDPGGRRLPAWTPRDGVTPDLPGALPEGRRAARPEGRQEARPERDTPRAMPGSPAAPGAPPDWQSRFAQVLAETLAGARPPQQMVPWTTEEALDRIRRLGPQLASQQRPRVRRVLTSIPATDVMELAVVVGFGPRVRAMAVRLERSRAHPGSGARPAARPGERAADRWVCTAVEAA
jgi:hypothetical protein